MELEKLLIDVARDAGATLREHAFDMGEITLKHEDDPVTCLDRAIEQGIKSAVLKIMPANFVGEEYGMEDNNAEYTWIIDPIDGTKSMIRGEFNTSLSIGVEQGGKLVAGCVYDFMRDIMYQGYDGRLRVFHGGSEVCLSHMPSAYKRIVIDGKNIRDSPLVMALQKRGVKAIEKNGSIALTMAQVAAGIYDGMVYNTENRWCAWDIAAGIYLLNCTGRALNLDMSPIKIDMPRKYIIGATYDMLPIIEVALLGGHHDHGDM